MQAKNIRQDIIKTLSQKGGNTAGNLSVADVLTALYSNIKHNPRKPKSEDRDRVIVTNNLCTAWHAALAHAGYFARKQLTQTTIELPKGTPPGQGPSIAIGSALAAKMDGKTHQTYCIISDAEHQHGQTWEAIMFAGKHKLNNLTLIVDRNNTQEDGYTENVMPIEPLRAKYEAFNWQVIEVDGHNTQHITEAIKEAKTNIKPTIILAHTIPGKGVSFIENRYEWHTKKPTKQEEKEALDELR